MSESRQDIKQSVESGEYYRDALNWYGTMYHAPISQRAMLIIITTFAVAIILMSLTGLFILLPLRETKSMIVRIPESLEHIATVHQLTDNPSQDPNKIVMDWFVRDFVTKREAYNIDKQQQFFRRIYVLSAPKVYNEYIRLYKSDNSPTIRYERHTKRVISLRDVDVRRMEVVEPATGDSPEVVDVQAYVEFQATEEAPSEDRKSKWGADITFRFSKIHVDQVTGDITPMEFKVTDYKSKQLGLE